MFSFFESKEKTKLIDNDFLRENLDSNYIGSNPEEKKGFFLKDLRDYKKKKNDDFYIIFEEVSKFSKKFSNKLDYYESSNNSHFYLELKKKIKIEEEGKIILTVNFDNRNIITSFKFKNNIYEYKKKEDSIQVVNSIYNLEFILFLRRESYNELFTIEKIQIFKN